MFCVFLVGFIGFLQVFSCFSGDVFCVFSRLYRVFYWFFVAFQVIFFIPLAFLFWAFWGLCFLGVLSRSKSDLGKLWLGSRFLMFHVLIFTRCFCWDDLLLEKNYRKPSAHNT